jgi:hypothetical protein
MPTSCLTVDSVCGISVRFMPGVETRGLMIARAVIDLVSIKLVGGDEGLGDFWNRWYDCFVRIRNLPRRGDYEYVFVYEMRSARMMVQYIKDYDEMDWNNPNETWQWLIKKGRASPDRARKRDNHIDSLHVLSGSNSVALAQHMTALLAIEDIRPQGSPNNGKGLSRLSGNQSPNASFVEPGQRPDHEPRRRRETCPSAPHSPEQRKANGPCWYFAYGGCIMPTCKKEHCVVTREEIAETPQEWMTKRTTAIANPNAQGKGGSESDSSNGSEGGRRDRPKGGGEDNEGGRKGAEGCKFVRNNKACPFGEECYSFWSRPVLPIAIAARVRSLGGSSGASGSSGGEIVHPKGIKPVYDAA